MPRLAALLLAAVALALTAAAPATAGTVRCRVGHYLTFTGSPVVSGLRAHDLPRRTGGYAPRCLVAEAIANEVQRGFREDGHGPRIVLVYGEGWSGGKWRCRFPDGGKARCHRKGKPRQRVTMALAA